MQLISVVAWKTRSYSQDYSCGDKESEKVREADKVNLNFCVSH